jgi:hypothetical protein
MSSDFDADDFARLLALEHLYCSLALMNVANFVAMNDMKPSEAAKLFRHAIEGAVHDGRVPPAAKASMRKHPGRILDGVQNMAKHTDLGS